MTTDLFECEHGCGQVTDDGKRFCSDECAECEQTDFDDSKADCAGVCWSSAG